MAEFRDVVEKWQSICKDYVECDGCPLQSVCDSVPAMTEKQIEKIEETIMKYAKSAPVYPTILELVHYIANRMPARKDGKVWARDIPLHELVMERVPYEVAEELGLVPLNECALRKYADDDIGGSEWR